MQYPLVHSFKFGILSVCFEIDIVPVCPQLTSSLSFARALNSNIVYLRLLQRIIAVSRMREGAVCTHDRDGSKTCGPERGFPALYSGVHRTEGAPG